MVAGSGTLSKALRAAAVSAAVCVGLLEGAAPASANRLSVAELTVTMTLYAQGVAEYRQFLAACGAVQADDWDEAAATLLASLRGAGLPESDATRLAALLAAADAGATSYDCGTEVSKLRLEFPPPSAWKDAHAAMLQGLEIAVVAPPSSGDARLETVREIVAADSRAQARMLGCMALVQPQYFPAAYADWYGLLTKTLQHILDAGYDTPVARGITDPARPGDLLAPVADRQAGVADCLSNQDWMQRWALFEAYALAERVREELAKPR
jgi:hypothetical protein